MAPTGWVERGRWSEAEGKDAERGEDVAGVEWSDAVGGTGARGGDAIEDL